MDDITRIGEDKEGRGMRKVVRESWWREQVSSSSVLLQATVNALWDELVIATVAGGRVSIFCMSVKYMSIMMNCTS